MTNEQEPEQQKDVSPEEKSRAEEAPPIKEQSVVWGEQKTVSEDHAITYTLGETTYEILLVGEGVLQVKEVGSEDPHFLASSGQKKGTVRMGHIRWDQPIIIRLPQPVKILPGATFETYSTYPTRPGLYWEVEGKEPMKLVELPGLTLKKTHYGPITGGSVCHLHEGPHKKDPSLLPDDPRVMAVNITIRNRTDEPCDVGILLLEPPLLSFFSTGNRPCLNRVEFVVNSETTGHVRHLNEPSLDGAQRVEAPLKEQDTGLSLHLFRSIIDEGSMSHGY